MIKLTTTQVKGIALISMIIDHTASVFSTVLPKWIVSSGEFIGGLAFPLFAYLLVEGFYRTRNFNRYLLRLALFWLISIIPFHLASNAVLTYPLGLDWTSIFNNVLFTLFCSLLMLGLLGKTTNKINYFFIVIVFALVTALSDWGVIGIGVTFLYYCFHQKKLAIYIVPFFISCYRLIHAICEFYILGFKAVSPNLINDTFVYCLSYFFTIPILQSITQTAQKPSRFFQIACYIFYPVHLLILFWIAQLLKM